MILTHVAAQWKYEQPIECSDIPHTALPGMLHVLESRMPHVQCILIKMAPSYFLSVER